MGLGDRLREARERVGLTQAQVAELLGVKPSTVGMWERGQHDVPTHHLVKMAEIYGVSNDWLLTGKEPKSYRLPAAAMKEPTVRGEDELPRPNEPITMQQLVEILRRKYGIEPQEP